MVFIQYLYKDKGNNVFCKGVVQVIDEGVYKNLYYLEITFKYNSIKSLI